jgi:hypothetical protein
MDRSTFMTRLQGKTLDAEALKREAPALNLKGLVKDGKIEGTEENLKALWNRIDDFDHNGSRASISDSQAMDIASKVLARGGASTTPVQTTAPTRGVGRANQMNGWEKVSAAGDESITSRTQAHNDAIDETGIGRYYGDHSSFHGNRNDKAALDATVRSMTNDQWSVTKTGIGKTELAGPEGATATLKENSCIGWVMENTAAAYKAAGKGDRWAQIEQKVKDAGMRGTVLAEELQKDGWTAVFYSPKTKDQLLASGTKDDKEKAAALAMANNGARVWKAGGVGDSRGVKVDTVISGYRDSEPDAQTEAALKQLEDAPFFVGVANGGRHTFVGHKGMVSEFHWDAEPNSKNALEETSVRDWEWDTGLYMIPPGQWTKSARNVAAQQGNT